MLLVHVLQQLTTVPYGSDGYLCLTIAVTHIGCAIRRWLIVGIHYACSSRLSWITVLNGHYKYKTMITYLKQGAWIIDHATIFPRRWGY